MRVNKICCNSVEKNNNEDVFHESQEITSNSAYKREQGYKESDLSFSESTWKIICQHTLIQTFFLSKNGTPFVCDPLKAKFHLANVKKESYYTKVMHISNCLPKLYGKKQKSCPP